MRGCELDGILDIESDTVNGDGSGFFFAAFRRNAELIATGSEKEGASGARRPHWRRAHWRAVCAPSRGADARRVARVRRARNGAQVTRRAVWATWMAACAGGTRGAPPPSATCRRGAFAARACAKTAWRLGTRVARGGARISFCCKLASGPQSARASHRRRGHSRGHVAHVSVHKSQCDVWLPSLLRARLAVERVGSGRRLRGARAESTVEAREGLAGLRVVCWRGC
ncbi:hypothetical protein FGB62_206g02 [Gracilaria domingensis]|nr:hypothetical protein FGB62_206g02 [Gracilaria domingensis]